MRFEAKKTITSLIVIALIISTGVYLARPRTIYGNPTGEIPFDMPATLGAYTAERVLFCTEDQCANSFRESALRIETNGVVEIASTCLVCGAELSPISIGETRLLPDNTPIFRREYKQEGVPPVHATVVFSGIERRSIHRPQICLISQGNRIINEYSRTLSIDSETTLQIRILELHQFHGEKDGKKTAVPGVYAYWLFNPERETDSHLMRFIHMAIDNSFRNYRPRWGYASLSFSVDPNRPNSWIEQLESFVPLFYPYIQDVRRQLDAQRDITTIISGRSADLNVYKGETGDVTDNPNKKRNYPKAEKPQPNSAPIPSDAL